MPRYLEDNLAEPLGRVLVEIASRLAQDPPQYMGVPIKKNPLDCWVYQEIIWNVRPDAIVEVGTGYGGSTLYLAHLLDLVGKGMVLTVDRNHSKVPVRVSDHPRIKLMTGDAGVVYEDVRAALERGAQQTVLVVEDSSHTYENTLAVLRTYSSLVTVGSYFIVEDSIHHHGLDEGPKPGPYEAIVDFVRENHDFVPDRGREKFVITFNPLGFLKRVAGVAA